MKSYNSGLYRYGFNGKEKDDEVDGVSGSSYDFEARMYDARIMRWTSVDILAPNNAYLSPYVYANSNPIALTDKDGLDWIYYDESGKELGRTKSKWYHFHWKIERDGWRVKRVDNHKKIVLTTKEIEQGGFFAIVNFTGGKPTDLHSSLVDVKTGDLYEARHPIQNGEPVNGQEFKDKDKTFYEANSQVVKFNGDKNYEFANKQWWNYKIKKKDGTYEDKSPSEVSVTYIWIPNREAMLHYLNGKVGGKIDWTPMNNCKTFTRDALMSGYTGVTDERHLEIKRNLEDEDVVPAEPFNEFNANKKIKNPDKSTTKNNVKK